MPLLVGSVLVAGLVVLPGRSVPFMGERPAGATGLGTLSTLSGSGSTGQADGSASSASFDSLADLEVDPTSNYLYAIDNGTGGRPNTIRRISRADGSVTTFASGGVLAGGASDLKVDGQGRVWVAVSVVSGGAAIVRFPASGGAGSVMVSNICCGYYSGLVGGAFAIDPSGSYVYYDQGWNDGSNNLSYLWRLPVASLPASADSGDRLGGAGHFTRSSMRDMEFASDGHLYMIWPGSGPWPGYGSFLWRYNGPSDFTAVSSNGPGNYRMAFSSSTSSAYLLCRCSFPGSRLMRASGFGAGAPDLIAGGSSGFADGSPGMMNSPTGLAISQDGTVAWVTDTNNHRIRKVALPALRV